MCQIIAIFRRLLYFPSLLSMAVRECCKHFLFPSDVVGCHTNLLRPFSSNLFSCCTALSSVITACRCGWQTWRKIWGTFNRQTAPPNLSICPTASAKWPHFLPDSYFLSDITRQSHNKRAHLKTSRPWIAAFWELHFSSALFKDLTRSSSTFDHHRLTVLTPFLQAQELRLRFLPVTFEGSVWSECVSNVSGQSLCVFVCVLSAEGMLCHLWPAGVKRGVFQHCSVKWLVQYTHTHTHRRTRTSIHAAQSLCDRSAKTRAKQTHKVNIEVREV